MTIFSVEIVPEDDSAMDNIAFGHCRNLQYIPDEPPREGGYVLIQTKKGTYPTVRIFRTVGGKPTFTPLNSNFQEDLIDPVVLGRCTRLLIFDE